MRTGYLLIFLFFLLVAAFGITGYILYEKKQHDYVQMEEPARYWLLLERKSNKERLYKGIPGEAKNSQLVREFQVKVGVPGEKPTPLPQLVGRKYWIITKKVDSSENPETSPYFLSLDVPGWDTEPYGPVPYNECNGQCNWQLEGEFGLHGVNGDESRLSSENPGSSGCIRHKDSDITFLYNLLDPENGEIRYYISDS